MTPHEAAARMKLPHTPAALAKDAQRRELARIRKRAWETRRKKYGPRGHDGSYSR